MRGVISAGSIPTAEAGARVLAEGGNAIDAAVAACFAVAAGEPTITSLAGGGMMIVRSARTGDVTVLDFFGNAPQMTQADHRALDFYDISLNYGPTTQRFFVGAGSAAVPGVIPGLCTALERWGSLSLSDVITPACEMLREGAILGSQQAGLALFLAPILTRNQPSRDIFSIGGRYIEAGDRFRLPVLADTLEAMAPNWRAFHDGPFRNQVLSQFGVNAGGLMTADDLKQYETYALRPLTVNTPHGVLHTMPPPASGGPMISLMRQLYLSASTGGSRELRLCAAMATADVARSQGRLTGDVRDYEWAIKVYQEQLNGVLVAPKMPGGPASTTHLSVIDAAGNAVGVTFSHGESNACVLDGMGIMMNNFLGEEDILPNGLGSAPPGQRLSTMMSPTIFQGHDGQSIVLGTGGSNRIRTAILQVIGRLLDEGASPQDAVNAPRLHFESGTLNAEVFMDADVHSLESISAHEFIRFNEPNLFFGGVNLACRSAEGQLDGGADARRGGHYIIVP